MYQLLNILFFSIYLLINPKLIYLWVFKGLYVPVLVQYLWLKKYKIETIIDVGANEGKVSQALRFLFPKAYIYAFEPNTKLHAKFKKRLGYEKVTLEGLALSDKPGKINFYEDVNPALSSTLPPKINSSQEKRIASASTLDEYFYDKKLGKVLLKLDVEGAEGLVLKGGTNFLKQVSVIHIETYFQKIHAKQDLFEDIYAFLTNEGFQYTGNIPEAYFYPKFNPIDVVNAIFIKN